MSRSPLQRSDQDPNQSGFDLEVLGIGHAKPNLTISEVSVALRMGEQSVRNLIDTGILVKCSKGAHSKEREHVTIERWSVRAWKLNQMEKQGVDTSTIPHGIMDRIWREQLAKREIGEFKPQTPQKKP